MILEIYIGILFVFKIRTVLFSSFKAKQNASIFMFTPVSSKLSELICFQCALKTSLLCQSYCMERGRKRERTNYHSSKVNVLSVVFLYVILSPVVTACIIIKSLFQNT